MKKLEVFFDYSCPYCLKGHENLLQLLPEFPDVEVVWRPCEAHPRPERYGRHSDLCIMGMFYAQNHGADIMKYHDIMYDACLKSRIDIEDLNLLASFASALVNEAEFKDEIKSGMYTAQLNDANSLAYDKSGVWAVPSYRMDGGKALDAVENVGVSKEDLRKFLEN
jgi:predicted DsbA family dithiol-disulfide isomerase